MRQGVVHRCIAGVEFGGGGGVAGECVDDKFQVLAWAPDRGLHIASSSSSSSSHHFLLLENCDILVGFKAGNVKWAYPHSR